MTSAIVIAAAFMALELWVIARIIDARALRRDQKAWTPLRKLFLDSIVAHADELEAVATEFIDRSNSHLDHVKACGSLDRDSLRQLFALIDESESALNLSRKEFFYVVQTVAPSMQPYAAQYCNEVLWFGDALLKTIKKARIYASDLLDVDLRDKNATSHPLNGVRAASTSVRMFHDFRFKNFKQLFTQDVWKRERLHYFEAEREFLPTEDYASALESEKSKRELANIPRTMPIKSFFDDD